MEPITGGVLSTKPWLKLPIDLIGEMGVLTLLLDMKLGWCRELDNVLLCLDIPVFSLDSRP